MPIPTLLVGTAYAAPVVSPITSGTALPADAVNSLFAGVADLVTLIAGILAIFYLVFAGLRYIMSAGSPDKIKQARSGLVNAVIGIIIVVAAYGIIRLAVIIGDQVSKSVQ